MQELYRDLIPLLLAIIQDVHAASAMTILAESVDDYGSRRKG
jgi:hypothetical protein